MIASSIRRASLAALLAALVHTAATAAAPDVATLGITVLGAPRQPQTAPANGHAARMKVPTVTIDSDAPGRNPFQAVASLSLANPIASIAIPAGYRLILEEVNVASAAASSNGPIQPIVLTYPYTAAHGSANPYFAPTQSGTVAGQFYSDYQVHQYAESLSVGIGFAGYTPSYLNATVTVSGHLISITP